MSEPEAAISRRRRIPAIWLVPAVAFVLGIWLVIYTAMTEGPEITIVFSTAEGIEAGKTKLKSRSVEIGLVEAVRLNEDLESVSVVAKLEREATPLLRDDTRFWVVRPRLGAGGVSGLGTIMSGAYIELEPGEEAPSDQRDFVGLENVPLTPVGTPGLKLVLVADRAGSVGPGDPLLYRGYRVGRVEETVFDDGTQQVRHHVFIDAPHDQLVNRATRFWNASGLAVEASAEGMRLEVGSLQSLLSGGVAFGVPDGKTPHGRVEHGAEFKLYDSYHATSQETYQHAAEFVVEFEQSVRGLVPGAPVEYRGIPVGSVRRVMLRELGASSADTSGAPIPVLIAIEPGRMTLPDTAEAAAAIRADIEQDVLNGGRASLKSGNLLTGSLFVSFDFYPEEGAAEIGSYAGYPTLPTLPGGLDRIERQISQLLAKLNDLELETTVREVNATLAAVRAAVGSDDMRELPATLDASLKKLDRTLQSVEALSRTVEEQPNSLIFSKTVQLDPEPRANHD